MTLYLVQLDLFYLWNFNCFRKSEDRSCFTGVDRTPVVEAQSNSTITVQYQDLTDNNTGTNASTGTKVKETATIDVDAPTPIVSSPTNGSSFKDRQPSFAGSATDIGSGLDVSTVILYVDVLDAAGGDTALSLGVTAGAC